jgi:DNA-binding transcriptional LysR family regulator
LTDAGEVLLEHCRGLFRQVEEMHRDIEESGSSVRGEVRIGASEVFAAFLLPTALARATGAHPGLVPRCYQMVPEEIVHGLIEGDLDVGFTVGGGSYEGVDALVIAESEGVLVCGRSHPLFEGGSISKEDFDAHAFVVPRHWQREYLTTLDQFPETSRSRRIGATTDRMALAISLVVEGAFLGYFPQVTIGCQLRHDELMVLEGGPPAPPFHLEALTRKGAKPRASALLVIEEVRRSVVETGGDPCGWSPDEA